MRPKPPRRSGVTLIEVLAMLGSGSVLLMIGVGLIGGAIRLDRSARQRLDATQSLARLAQQFRLDVAAAQSATVTDATQLTLAAPDQDSRRVEYVLGAEQVQRQVWEQDQSRDRGRYRLPADSQAAFDVRVEDGQSLARLKISARAAPDRARALSMEAVVGRDARFAGNAVAQQGEAP